MDFWHNSEEYLSSGVSSGILVGNNKHLYFQFWAKIRISWRNIHPCTLALPPLPWKLLDFSIIELDSLLPGLGSGE